MTDDDIRAAVDRAKVLNEFSRRFAGDDKTLDEVRVVLVDLVVTCGALLAERDRYRREIEAAGANPAGFDWSVLERLDRLETAEAERDAAVARIAALEEWRDAVSGAVKNLPEWNSGQWGGDKDGWGYHFEVINWLIRRRAALEATGTPLAWTTDVPTAEGVYWYDGGYGPGTVEIVYMADRGRYELEYDQSGPRSLEELGGKWAGPILLPREG